MFAGFENRHRNDSTFGIADVLAFKLAAELRLYDLGTQTWGLGLVVEVDTIDGVLVLIECEVTADAAPETLTGKRQDVLGSTFEVSYVNLLLAVSEGVLYERVIDLCRVSLREIDFQRTEDLFLLVEQDIRLLLRSECLADNRQQHSYDDHYHRHIDECVDITVCIQFHSVPPFWLSTFDF